MVWYLEAQQLLHYHTFAEVSRLAQKVLTQRDAAIRRAATSFPKIQGHETLEMTRKYIDMVAIQEAITESRRSPVDEMDLNNPNTAKQIA